MCSVRRCVKVNMISSPSGFFERILIQTTWAAIAQRMFLMKEGGIIVSKSYSTEEKG